MPWYTELTKVPTVNSWKTPELQAAVTAKVVDLYKLVIRYLLANARFHDHSTYRFAPNSAKWRSWETMVADIQAAELELQWCIQTHSGKSLKRALNEGGRQGENIKNIISVFSVAQRRANLLDKLMPEARLSHADTYRDYVNQIASPHSNTGHGVLSHSAFTNWSNADSGLLVLTGQPGTGKSVLAKYLLTELARVRPLSLCSFFFKDGAEHNLNTALHEVLYCIVQQCSHLDEVEEKVEQATRHSVRPDADLFWELIEIASRGTPQGQVAVVLDALDECQNAHLEPALKLLNGYQSRFPESKVKFLLTTRPAPGLLEALTNGTILNLDDDAECREAIMGDIGRVAQDQVEYFAREKSIRDQGTRSKLLRHLEMHDNSSYLFTDLLFTYLYSLPVRPGTNYWSRMFDHLPRTVIEIYRALLDQIHESNRDDVRIMLELVLASTKPLSIREAAIALAIHVDDCTSCDREDELGLPAEDFKAWLSDTCGPFFDVYNDRIYLAHQTVRDYLLPSEGQTEKPGWLEQLSTESCHQTMARSCFAYHSLPFVTKNKFMSIEEYIQAPFYTKRAYHRWCQESFVFAEHAFANWVVHVKKSLRPSHHQTDKDENHQDLFEEQEYPTGAQKPSDKTHERASQESETAFETESEASSEEQFEDPLDDTTESKTEGDEQEEVAHDANESGDNAEDTVERADDQTKEVADQNEREIYSTPDEMRGRTEGQIVDVTDGLNETQKSSSRLIDQVHELFPEFQPQLALSLFCCCAIPASCDVRTFVEMLPMENPARDDILIALSQSLMARYCHLGDRLDLEYGSDLAEQVLKRTRRGHPQLTPRLATFDQGLNMRFWDAVHHESPITGNEMRVADKAVTVAPTGHPRRPAALYQRATVLEKKYQRTKDAVAINKAIADILNVVALVSPSLSAKPRYLDYLANLLGQRFLDGGNAADLDLAIKAAEEAVATSEFVTPNDTQVVAMHRSTLASWLGARYRMTRQQSDIERALEVIRVVLDITSVDDSSLPIYLCNYARRLYERYEETGVEEDLSKAIALSRRAAERTSPEHPIYPFHNLFHQVLSTGDSD